MIANSSGNFENFSLKDFLQLEGKTVGERVAGFSEYFRQQQEAGLALYMREAEGPADHRTRIKDPQTGGIREMVMFGSNNYLGLANHPAVIERVKRAVDEFGIGAGGPPLLNGMSRLHRELEQRLAALKQTEDAMLFSSGFLTNVGWVGALVCRGDLVLYDELNHASLIDGLLANRCPSKSFAHNDLEQLAALLAKARTAGKRNIFVVAEGVYSMEGDLGRLPEISALCRNHEAFLVLDDAHGLGVMGEHGAGTAEHFGLKGSVDLTLGTFSKVFATTGGFLAGDRALIDYLRFFARSYMFSASLPHPVVASVLGGLEVMEREPERLVQLRLNVRTLVDGLNRLGYRVATDSAIISLLVPTGVDMRRLARSIHERAVFVNSIEYPAVPLDAQRLRLSVMATHTQEDLALALEAFEQVGREFGMIE